MNFIWGQSCICRNATLFLNSTTQRERAAAQSSGQKLPCFRERERNSQVLSSQFCSFSIHRCSLCLSIDLHLFFLGETVSWENENVMLGLLKCGVWYAKFFDLWFGPFSRWDIRVYVYGWLVMKMIVNVSTDKNDLGIVNYCELVWIILMNLKLDNGAENFLMWVGWWSE